MRNVVMNGLIGMDMVQQWCDDGGDACHYFVCAGSYDAKVTQSEGSACCKYDNVVTVHGDGSNGDEGGLNLWLFCMT